ncbi:MAG: polysaccharide lyase [Planctomycetaceae bacterium]|nr:MAG: polysaccharide lyase [Planctomycetaceae bacterium]
MFPLSLSYWLCWSTTLQLTLSASPSPTLLRDVLIRAVNFFHDKVSVHGGYNWRYAADLTYAEGENAAGRQTVWVQPPGTPAVGEAFLQAYLLTGEASCLTAAKDAAHCLLEGQLRSGGWQDRIEFSSEARTKIAYRRSQPASSRAKNFSSLDDDKTQSALRFLMRLDQALSGSDASIHEAINYALTHLMKAQRPNGGWPQVWEEPADANRYRDLRATIPSDWPRQHPKADYWHYYTLNDSAHMDTVEVFLIAYAIYAKPEYLEAARRGGDFLMKAQLPDPQPAWAQQYDAEMRPAWARTFEPPAITGEESQRALLCLMNIYLHTGDPRYLEPIPSALHYLKSLRLPDGQLARFYELGTNRPLYFNKRYELTYDDDDLPQHYGFKVNDDTDRISKTYERYLRLKPHEREREKSRKLAYPPVKSPPSADTLTHLIQQQRSDGAWVERGKLRTYRGPNPPQEIISSQTFINNILMLARAITQRPQ